MLLERWRLWGFAAESEEMPMADGFSPKPPGRVRGRPFETGRSGNPAGRRVGCRNKTTIAAASLLAGEAATFAAELAMPDLDLIKQAEQGCGTGAGVRQGPGGQSRRPAARLVVD